VRRAEVAADDRVSLDRRVPPYLAWWAEDLAPAQLNRRQVAGFVEHPLTAESSRRPPEVAKLLSIAST
jgi:hypothetical protein